MGFFTRKTIGIYVAFWVVLTIGFVTYIVLANVSVRTFTCMDGTVVKEKAECPNCINNTHCKRDNICDDGACVPKSCVVDSDCDDPVNRCVYEKCILG